MNCDDFEMLMADALGDELAEGDRAAFESHLATCETCRREYESLTRTVDAARTLAGPRRVCVQRDGQRLVIQPAESDAHTPSRGSVRAAVRNGGLLRFAASILVAFTAGYAVHAGLMMAGDARPEQQITQIENVAPPSVRGSLALAHARNPSRSGLAKCLATITRPRP